MRYDRSGCPPPAPGPPGLPSSRTRSPAGRSQRATWIEAKKSLASTTPPQLKNTNSMPSSFAMISPAATCRSLAARPAGCSSRFPAGRAACGRRSDRGRRPPAEIGEPHELHFDRPPIAAFGLRIAVTRTMQATPGRTRGSLHNDLRGFRTVQVRCPIAETRIRHRVQPERRLKRRSHHHVFDRPLLRHRASSSFHSNHCTSHFFRTLLALSHRRLSLRESSTPIVAFRSAKSCAPIVAFRSAKVVTIVAFPPRKLRALATFAERKATLLSAPILTLSHRLVNQASHNRSETPRALVESASSNST